jgi:hypothetical protein
LKSSPSYAKLKLNRVELDDSGSKKKLASAGLAPIVTPASTSFVNPAFLLLAVVYLLGEKTEISLL